MFDSFVYLAPLLLLPVAALLVFVGCNQIFGLNDNLVERSKFAQLLANDVATANTDVLTVMYTGTAKAGHLLLVWIWYRTSSSQTVASVTDSAGNSFQPVDVPVAGAGPLADHRQEVWYAKNILTGGPEPGTLTATFTGAVAPSIGVDVFEYSGADLHAPIVATSHATGSGAVAATSVASTADAHILFGVCIFSGVGTSATDANQRFTQRGNVAEDYIGQMLPNEVSFLAEFPATQDWLAMAVALK